ncbi:MAG: restriction endonuclease subunit S, partial [Dehalococcoidia bacterium]|nr:restriction endonuclease subunit S [Dehalococcoidia bacterium]
FVDFDPVRAQMEGRGRPGKSLPGLPADLYDLLPNRLVDSELGEIPEGWEVKALGELVELAYGKALRAVDREDGPVPVYGSNGQVGWHDANLVAGPGIVVGRKGNPGIVTWAHGDFFPIDTTFYVVPRDANGGMPFLFFALTWQDLPSVSADSAVPGLNRNVAYMNKQLVPDEQVLAEFNDYASALFSRRHRLEQESRELTAQRDALLPWLVFGEIGVKTE